MRIEGGCHCGFIKYEGDADPEKAAICHCTDCQTLSGSAFRTVVPTSEGTFKLLSGEPKVYVKTGESGNKRVQTFCPDCGSPLTHVSGKHPPFLIVHGTAEISEELDAVRHWAAVIGGRYMGADRAEEYGTRNGVPGELLVRVRPAKVLGERGVAD